MDVVFGLFEGIVSRLLAVIHLLHNLIKSQRIFRVNLSIVEMHELSEPQLERVLVSLYSYLDSRIRSALHEYLLHFILRETMKCVMRHPP